MSGYTVAFKVASHCCRLPAQQRCSSLPWTFVCCAAMLGVATAASVKMAKEQPKVVWPLMAPYLCWVTFATALNVELLRLNPDVSKPARCMCACCACCGLC